MADGIAIEQPAVKWAARGVLVVALGIAASWFHRASPMTPEEAIRKWFEAAARGDVRTVLALCREPLQGELASSARQEGLALSTAALQSSMSGVKGLGIQKLDLGPDRGVFLVELVHSDRNERHRMELIRMGQQWFIVRIESDSPVVPPVRYGTPAFEE
jgi:hypothetical protein